MTVVLIMLLFSIFSVPFSIWCINDYITKTKPFSEKLKIHLHVSLPIGIIISLFFTLAIIFKVEENSISIVFNIITLIFLFAGIISKSCHDRISLYIKKSKAQKVQIDLATCNDKTTIKSNLAICKNHINKVSFKEWITTNRIYIILTAIIIVIIVIPFTNSMIAKSKEINPETYIVYVTKSGECYHKEDCFCIQNRNKIPITLEEAMEEGYRPCENCEPPDISYQYYFGGEIENIY